MFTVHALASVRRWVMRHAPHSEVQPAGWRIAVSVKSLLGVTTEASSTVPSNQSSPHKTLTQAANVKSIEIALSLQMSGAEKGSLVPLGRDKRANQAALQPASITGSKPNDYPIKPKS